MNESPTTTWNDENYTVPTANIEAMLELLIVAESWESMAARAESLRSAARPIEEPSRHE